MSVNPFLLQKVLRENASDLHDFSKDLKNWGVEMKHKEDSQKNQGQKTVPTPGNKFRKVEKQISNKEIEKKIGLTDYSKWEKFDADAELDRLDDDYEEDSELTDECNDNMYDEAIVEKEKGNNFVKNRKWDEAISCYTKAIKCYSFDPIFYANRALCYLKTSQYDEAERDCNLSLKLDEKYVKALQRRAAARIALDKLEDAELDFSKVLELEPKNKETKIELDKLRFRLNKVEKCMEQRPVSKFTASRNKVGTSVNLSKPSISNATETEQKLYSPWPDNDDIIIVKPIKKSPHLQSKKPLQRIEVIEIDSSFQKNIEIEDAVKDHVLEKKENVPALVIKENVKEKIVPVEKIAEIPKIISAFKNNKPSKTVNTNHPGAWPNPEQNSEVLTADDLKIIEKTTINCELIESEKETMEEYNFSVPKNYVQFNLTWKNLKTSKMKYVYLKSIDPMNYPKIFLESLESNVFSDILNVLVEHFIEKKEAVYDILESFTNVKRFATITMFLTSGDKGNLWKLFDYLRQRQEKEEQLVDVLIKKYEI